MIIISGGDDSRMREIIKNALTEADEPFILTEDESDIISTEQAISLIVYNASKIRTYLGRLERNTRKLEEDLRHQAEHVEQISQFLEPQAVYFESRLPEHVSDRPEKRRIQSRLEEVRYKRWRSKDERRRKFEQAVSGTNEEKPSGSEHQSS